MITRLTEGWVVLYWLLVAYALILMLKRVITSGGYVVSYVANVCVRGIEWGNE